MSIAFIFAGQGSQQIHMLHLIKQLFPIQETIEEASEVLRKDALLLDSKEALASTRAVQLSLLISGVSIGRALIEKGVSPDFVAGHSVGAFAAAVISGALTFEDAIRLVDLRGKLMEAMYPIGYGMGVIIGLNEQSVIQLISKVYTPELPVYVANINTKYQITIAGSRGAIEKVFEVAQQHGVQKTQFLNVSVPSHCVMLEEVAKRLAEEMSTIKMQAPRVPFIGNCSGRVLRAADALRQDLSSGVAKPVRWYESMHGLYERRVRLFIEAGWSQVLSNLLKKDFPQVRTLSMETCSLESAFILAHKEER